MLRSSHVSKHRIINCKTSIATGLLLGRYYFLQQIFSTPTKDTELKLLSNIPFFMLHNYVKKSMVVWPLFSCFSFYNFQRPKPFLMYRDFMFLHILFFFFFIITDNLLYNTYMSVYFIIDFLLRYLWMLSSLFESI